MNEWIVAHCQPNSEVKAEAHLRRQGYRVYLPKYRKTRRHARRVETVVRPLFPRYLFIAYDEGATRWRPIRSTVGISHLITAGEKPMRVPPWVIDELRTREDGDGLYAGAAAESLRKGDSVEIVHGPFFDQRGVFDGLGEAQRVAVLLDIMGRQVKASVPLEAIRRA